MRLFIYLPLFAAAGNDFEVTEKKTRNLKTTKLLLNGLACVYA